MAQPSIRKQLAIYQPLTDHYQSSIYPYLTSTEPLVNHQSINEYQYLTIISHWLTIGKPVPPMKRYLAIHYFAMNQEVISIVYYQPLVNYSLLDPYLIIFYPLLAITIWSTIHYFTFSSIGQ